LDVVFEASFARDLRRIREKQLRQRAKDVINEVKDASDISQVRSLKKLQGWDTYYRIRLGDYRIGIEIVDEEVIFVRFLHRRDIYRRFP
jgi:mRNA interferase RelE/StbE